MGRRVLWPGVLHGCYRQSRLETAGVTLMIQAHRAAGIWRSRVDLFVALSQFARKKFIEGGLPAKKILVKPNFVHPDPGPRRMEEDFALFVGRLSKEKGIGVLLDAWRRVPEIPLVICGDGPMRELVNRFARSLPRGKIRFVQSLSRPHVFDAMRRARFLVFPSICYESFPMVVAEALACGLPVLASGIGAAAEIVEDGKTGVHFAPGDPDALASAAGRLWSSPSEARESGARARAEFLARYTAERAHASLMEIYSRAREESGQG